MWYQHFLLCPNHGPLLQLAAFFIALHLRRTHHWLLNPAFLSPPHSIQPWPHFIQPWLSCLFLSCSPCSFLWLFFLLLPSPTLFPSFTANPPPLVSSLPFPSPPLLSSPPLSRPPPHWSTATSCLTETLQAFHSLLIKRDYCQRINLWECCGDSILTPPPAHWSLPPRRYSLDSTYFYS